MRRAPLLDRSGLEGRLDAERDVSGQGHADRAAVLGRLRVDEPLAAAQHNTLISVFLLLTIVFALDEAFDNAARIAALLARPEVERDLHAPPGNNDEPR